MLFTTYRKIVIINCNLIWVLFLNIYDILDTFYFTFLFTYYLFKRSTLFVSVNDSLLRKTEDLR